ncbi:MAG: DUF2220 domain-containing protein [Treponema sp.]|nr:DUF2220 domain-containing protein [Treponema sp.]
MSDWKKKIIDELINHYFDSSVQEEERECVRVRSLLFFPDFDSAHPDEKDAYIEAALELEQKQVVQLRWEKRGKGERIKTITCENFESIFAEAGMLYPKEEAIKIRAMLDAKVNELKVKGLTKNVIHLVEYLSDNFCSREIGQGINQKIIEDLIRYLEFANDSAKPQKITIRALSILLYNDSKRLENLISVCSPFISRAQKAISVSDFTFPDRSYPEVMISGKIIFEYKKPDTPLVNAKGLMLNLPLESVQVISVIKPINEKSQKKVLTIENKETFYALAGSQAENDSYLQYDCFLFTSGYPNRAVAALIEILAASGFSFYHAGDLDPDGILILQNIQNIAKQSVTPIRMDVSTFDQYRKWARPLIKSMLGQIKKIREETRSIPGLEELLQRIEKTGLGVEQEIVDYRQ